MPHNALSTVIVLDPSEYAQETLHMLGESFDVHTGHVSTPQRAHASAVFVELGTAVDGTFLDQFPNLRFVVTPTTGTTHIDAEAVQMRDVEVIALRRSAPELMEISATAELTWGLLLALTRHIPQASNAVVSGLWQRRPFRGIELRGLTLGIVGLGRLGRYVAKYGHAFGMRVVAHDTDPSVFAHVEFDVESVSANKLLNESDVVSLHLPYTPGDGPWLDAGRISAMREGAFLLNTARGELIDEQALTRAISQGRLRGFGADVLVGDSRWTVQVPDGNPLVNLAREGANVVITPHTGGFAVPALWQARHLIAQDFLARVQADQAS